MGSEYVTLTPACALCDLTLCLRGQNRTLLL